MKRFLLPFITACLLFSAGYLYTAEIGDLDVTDANNTGRFPEGMAPSAVNNGARALEGIIARYVSDTSAGAITGGSSNTYTFSAAQTLSSYYDGLIICVDANHTNSGAATLNVDSVGAKQWLKHGDDQLESGDIIAGGKYCSIYDGAAWQLISIPAQFNAATSSVDTNELVANSVDGTKIAIGSDAQGDVLYYDGTNYARLGAGTSGQFLKTQGAGANPTWDDVTTTIGQVVSSVSTGVATGATAIPADDTIPQCTSEGTEFHSLAITPTNASSTLVIDVTVFGSISTNGQVYAILCVDSTANALAAVGAAADASDRETISFTHSLSAGSTSARTYKVRVGPSAGTFTFNGAGGTRLFGGVANSSITITEVLP